MTNEYELALPVPQPLTQAMAAGIDITPSRDTNKYRRGTLSIVGGSETYPGAAALSAAAAQRMGAGYTRVFCDPAARDVIRSFRPSLVVQSWEGREVDEAIHTHSSHPVAWALGSGTTAQDKRAQALVLEALTQVQAPLLLDGGALRVLAGEQGRNAAQIRQQRNKPLVLTPHGGEAARLAEPFSIATDNPAEEAALLARAYEAVVVLKGPDTFISDGIETWVMDLGTPALAKAGTGDVLAGMIGSLLAQGVDPLHAAGLGALLHGQAGREAALRVGEIAVIPEDVIEALPAALRLCF